MKAVVSYVMLYQCTVFISKLSLGIMFFSSSPWAEWFSVTRQEDGWAAGCTADWDQATADQQGELRGGRWQAAKVHNCTPELICKSHIQMKEACGTHLKWVSTPYGPTRQIHTLIHSACTLCSTVHQSELFISAWLSRGERKEGERARKSILKKKKRL